MLLRHCDWVDQLQHHEQVFSKVVHREPLPGEEVGEGGVAHKAERTKLEQAKTCELESQCGSELRSICRQREGEREKSEESVAAEAERERGERARDRSRQCNAA